MPTEVAGTLSTFGHQVLSTKLTNARTKFGTSNREQSAPGETAVGATSDGVNTKLQSGFGHQTASRCGTAPAYGFGNRYASDQDMSKEGRPGPGSYETPSCVGKQTLSPKANQPSWRVGTGNRWSTYSRVWKPDFETPAADHCRPASGWLGDSPKYTFFGKAQRADIRKGLPGSDPSCLHNPAPGSYELPSGLGMQQDSRKQSASRIRMGTASRDGIRKSQYFGTAQNEDLYGRHSPAPNAYDPTHGLSKSSRIPSATTMKFGSGDRFSQVKSRPTSRQSRPASRQGPSEFPHFMTPGPGSYVV